MPDDLRIYRFTTPGGRTIVSEDCTDEDLGYARKLGHKIEKLVTETEAAEIGRSKLAAAIMPLRHRAEAGDRLAAALRDGIEKIRAELGQHHGYTGAAAASYRDAAELHGGAALDQVSDLIDELWPPQTASMMTPQQLDEARARTVGLSVGLPDLVAHLERQAAFSLRTFGPGWRTEGISDHIRKELAEIAEHPADVEEWIDVAILAFDGAWRTGASPRLIVDTLLAKQAKNEARRWPDWRTAEPGKAIEHVREPTALDASRAEAYTEQFAREDAANEPPPAWRAPKAQDRSLAR